MLRALCINVIFALFAILVNFLSISFSYHFNHFILHYDINDSASSVRANMGIPANAHDNVPSRQFTIARNE